MVVLDCTGLELELRPDSCGMTIVEVNCDLWAAVQFATSRKSLDSTTIKRHPLRRH
jgi:hypothetical protein